MLPKDLSSVAALLFHDCEQQRFGRDELVLELVRLFLRLSENLSHSRTEILLAPLDAWKTSDSRLRVVKNDRDVGAELTNQWPRSEERRVGKECRSRWSRSQ